MSWIKYLKSLGFIVLFAWISLFPAPLQQQYEIYTKIFSVLFLLILLVGSKPIKDFFKISDWPAWVFIVCLGAGTISATNKNLATETYFYLVTTFLALFYIGKVILSSTHGRDTVILSICICSALVSVIGLLELYFGSNILYERFIINPYYRRYIEIDPRPMSTQFNPAPLATYLLATWPFGICMFNHRNRIKRYLGYVVVALGITCLALTFCRSSFLGLIAVLFFYQYIKRDYRGFFIVFLIFIILLIGLSFMPYPLNRFSINGILTYDTGILSRYRMSRVKVTLQMLKDSPLFGIGLNHFRILFGKYAPTKPWNVDVADNMHLSLLAEAGIIGMSGFFILIFSLFKNGLRYLKSLKDRYRWQLLAVTMSVLCGLLVNMGGYELFYWNNPYMLFCLICGFIYGSGHDIN